MQARAASSLGGPQTKLLTELRKTGTEGVIGQRVPLLRDKEHVCQGVIAEGGAQRAIARSWAAVVGCKGTNRDLWNFVSRMCTSAGTSSSAHRLS